MLFSKDDDKKKRLKENMSKIRELIEDKDVGKPDFSRDDIDNLGATEGDERKSKENKPEGDLPEIPEPPSKTKGSEQSEKSSRRTRRDNRSLDLNSPKIPKPAKTRDINVPDINKGPLFITKEKFFEASDRVQSMKKLSRELETNLEQLRETLYEDEDISSDLNNVLEEVNGNVNNLKDIVSP